MKSSMLITTSIVALVLTTGSVPQAFASAKFFDSDGMMLESGKIAIQFTGDTVKISDDYASAPKDEITDLTVVDPRALIANGYGIVISRALANQKLKLSTGIGHTKIDLDGVTTLVRAIDISTAIETKLITSTDGIDSDDDIVIIALGEVAEYILGLTDAETPITLDSADVVHYFITSYLTAGTDAAIADADHKEADISSTSGADASAKDRVVEQA